MNKISAIEKEKLMDGFYKACAYIDWNMLEEAMETNNWSWATINRVPDRNDMLDCCKQLFYDCIENINPESHDEFYGASTGGFEVELDKVDNEYTIEIKFVLSKAISTVEL